MSPGVLGWSGRVKLPDRDPDRGEGDGVDLQGYGDELLGNQSRSQFPDSSVQRKVNEEEV